MSEQIIPDVEFASDVVVAEAAEIAEPAVNYSEKTLAELVKLLEELVQSEDRMKLSKDAEAIKSAFYKRLQKEKAEAGLVAEQVVEPDAEAEVETEAETPVEEEATTNPFVEIERGFKALYVNYKKERAEYNKQLEKEREQNLAQKEAIVADLKALLEKQEDVNETFPQFREIQNRWRAVGPVPAQSYRNINETYQLYVEQFYDMVKINRELRDLDFKKNLEAKEEFCQLAEKLAENENVIEAFRELQKLHEQWKEFGPVAKEFREQIWERFKAATATVNKRYQAYFEAIKEVHAENLAKKTVLCEKVEEIAEREVTDSNQWNAFSKEIEEIQKEWKTIGFASKKENQKVYDRFRAACDKFFSRKREFYNEYKDNKSEDEYFEWLEQITKGYPVVMIHYPEALYKFAFQIGQFPERVASWVYNSNTPRQHRDIAYFGIKPDFTLMHQPYKNPTDKRIAKRIAEGHEGGMLYDWWEINQVKNVSKEKNGVTHPCQMPVEVMQRVVGIIDPEYVIIDPFMGSGTTAIACIKERRHFIGFELSKEYFDKAVRRIKAEQAQLTLF